MKPSERHRVAAIDAEIDELLAQWRKLSKERSAITRRVSMRAYMRNRKAKESDMNDAVPDAVPCPWGLLAALVAELRQQNAHAGFERPDEEYVEVHLKAGDIRRIAAAVNGAGA